MNDKELLAKYPGLQHEVDTHPDEDAEATERDQLVQKLRDRHQGRMKLGALDHQVIKQLGGNYQVTLTQVDLLCVVEGLKLFRTKLVDEITSSQLAETDEGRRLEDLMFLGEQLAITAHMSYQIEEVMGL